MNNHPNNRNWQEIYPKFQMAPLGLRLYCIFSTAITLFSVLKFWLPKRTQATIVPITGWSMAGGYSFTLFFAFALIFSNNIKIDKIKMRFAVIIILLLNLGCDGINILFHYNDNNFGNPYLTISILQPIYTVLLPLLWIRVLMSKNITRFCKKF